MSAPLAASADAEGNVSKSNQSQDKKIQILKAATALLNEQGLQALSFENLAHASGLSRQLIRYYFSSLDTLVSELCDYLGNTYREILVAGVLQVGQVERLRFFTDFLFDLTDEHRMPDNLEAYDALVAYAVGSIGVRERLCEKYKTLGQVIAHELAIAHPELDGPACEELSFLFVSMMHAHWSFVASLGFSRQHSLVIRNAIDRLIASYVNEQTPSERIKGMWAQKK
ncbi:MAG: TetR/AcrR family transcriptional regulator [Pseudomonadota bacterium]